MAKTNVFLLSIVLFVSLSSLSHGLIINGLPITRMEVEGVLRSTFTGNQNAPPLSGQTVSFNCAGASSNTVTDPEGLYTFVEKVADTTLVDPARCLVTVTPPVPRRGEFTIPPNAILGSGIRLVNVNQTSDGNIAYYRGDDFVLIYL